MQKEELVRVQEFCVSHELEISFIYALQQYGLISITTIEETIYLPISQLEQAEQIARLHNELGINFEGIDAIRHLLERVQEMQQEIRALRNRLSLFE